MFVCKKGLWLNYYLPRFMYTTLQSGEEQTWVAGFKVGCLFPSIQKLHTYHIKISHLAHYHKTN